MNHYLSGTCEGCYQGWMGRWWCDNCDQWPCVCLEDEDEN